MQLSNLDFSYDAEFSWIVILLLVAGVSAILSGLLFGGRSAGWRALDVAIGLGFVGYGVYLGFVFEGGEYWVPYYAFIVPVLLIVQAFAKWRESKKAEVSAPGRPYVGQPQAGALPYQAQPGQPYAGQPGQPYAGQPGQPMQPYQAQPGQPQVPGAGWGQPGQPQAGVQPYSGQPTASSPAQPYQAPQPYTEPGSPNQR